MHSPQRCIGETSIASFGGLRALACLASQPIHFSTAAAEVRPALIRDRTELQMNASRCSHTSAQSPRPPRSPRRALCRRLTGESRDVASHEPLDGTGLHSFRRRDSIARHADRLSFECQRKQALEQVTYRQNPAMSALACLRENCLASRAQQERP